MNGTQSHLALINLAKTRIFPIDTIEEKVFTEKITKTPNSNQPPCLSLALPLLGFQITSIWYITCLRHLYPTKNLYYQRCKIPNLRPRSPYKYNHKKGTQKVPKNRKGHQILILMMDYADMSG